MGGREILFRTRECPFLATNDAVAQEDRAQVERKRRIQEHSHDHVSKTKPEILKLANQQITAVQTALKVHIRQYADMFTIGIILRMILMSLLMCNSFV